MINIFRLLFKVLHFDEPKVGHYEMSCPEFCNEVAKIKFVRSNSPLSKELAILSKRSDLTPEQVIAALDCYLQINQLPSSAIIANSLPRIASFCFATQGDEFVLGQSLKLLPSDQVKAEKFRFYFLTPRLPQAKLNKKQFVDVLMSGKWTWLFLCLLISIPPVLLSAVIQLLQEPLFDTLVPEANIPFIVIIGFATVVTQISSQAITTLGSLYQEYFNTRVELETQVAAASRFLSAKSGTLPPKDAGSWRMTFSVASAFLGSLQTASISIPLAIISMIANMFVVGAFVDSSGIINLFLLLLIPSLITVGISYASANISVRLMGQESRLESIIYDVVKQIRNIWLLGMEDNYSKRFAIARSQMASNVIITGFMDSISSIISSVFQGFLYAYIFYQYYRGVIQPSVATITPGSLLVIYFAIGTISGALDSLSGDFVSIAQSLPTYWTPNALRDITKFRSQKPFQPYPPPARIRFNEVIFTQGDQTIPFPKPLSFEFVIGSSYALMGASGAGKSTLLRLLIGNLEPISGAIQLFDEQGFESKYELQNTKLLFLSQDTTLCGSTLQDVVDPGRCCEINELEAACKQLDLDKVLDNLPLRWKTPINEFSRDLSLGQLQLFKISRCLLDDYDIILSDEPTCNLPEDLHRKALALLNSRSKTHISVLHRESAIDLFDSVVVIESDSSVTISPTTAQANLDIQ